MSLDGTLAGCIELSVPLDGASFSPKRTLVASFHTACTLRHPLAIPRTRQRTQDTHLSFSHLSPFLLTLFLLHATINRSLLLLNGGFLPVKTRDTCIPHVSVGHVQRERSCRFERVSACPLQ